MTLFRSMGARPDDTRGTTAVEVRKGLAGLFTSPGVLPGYSAPIVQGTSGWQYQVNRSWFVTRRLAADGTHFFGNDGPVLVTTDPAPGAGLSRVDLIWVRHPSADENGDTTSEPEFGVTRGTPASIPQPPTLPDGALELAQATVASSHENTSAASITLTGTPAGLTGAVLGVANTTERAAVVAARAAAGNPITPVSPQYVHRANAVQEASLEFTEDGTTWAAVGQEPVWDLVLNTEQNVPNRDWWSPSSGWTRNVYNGAAMPTTSGVLTVPTAGLYAITMSARFAPRATGRRLVGIGINGSDPSGRNRSEVPGVSGSAAAQAATTINRVLDAGDQLRLMLYQSSGAALTLGDMTSLTVTRLTTFR